MLWIINAARFLAQSIGWMSAGYVASDILDKTTEQSGNPVPAGGGSSASKRIDFLQTFLNIPRYLVWGLLLIIGLFLITKFKIKSR